MNFFKLSKEIKNSRKICTEFYSRFFSQIFSHYFSSLFILLGISPNIITGLMGLLVIPLSLLFYFSNEFYAIIYSFLFVVINILDTSDGEVARYTKKTSTKGVFYDKFFQLFSDAVIISTIIFKFLADDEITLFYMSFIYLIIYFLLLSLKQLSNIFLKNYQTINKENFLKKFLSIMSSNTFFTHTLWILFFSKFYFDRFVFEFISIIYMGNLIILNLVKCIIIFNALRKKII